MYVCVCKEMRTYYLQEIYYFLSLKPNSYAVYILYTYNRTQHAIHCQKEMLIM